VPPAVIVFEFDPTIRLGGLAIRWETLGIALAILVALVTAAILVRVVAAPTGERLRRDDLLFIGLGAVPGAVIGGRIGYVLVHLDFYLAHPSAIVDAGQGGFQLSLAVVGGAVTGLYVSRLLEAPSRTWLHVSAIPVLLAIEGGKAAMAFGGSGQGQLRADGLATAYLGVGPWGSLAPALPSIPAQLVESGATAALAIVLVVALAVGAFGRRDGRLFLVAFAGWLVLRLAIATTWRDPAVLGPLRADQVISLVLLVVAIGGLLAWDRRSRSEDDGPAAVSSVVLERATNEVDR
jgi:phosphatidylglycerol:prolipoprotein diacylglycerol transferase